MGENHEKEKDEDNQEKEICLAIDLNDTRWIVTSVTSTLDRIPVLHVCVCSRQLLSTKENAPPQEQPRTSPCTSTSTHACAPHTHRVLPAAA